MRGKIILMAGVALTAVSAGSALAGGFAVREQSAVGQGSSFAGAGTPGMGLSAMFWNPAAVTQTRGTQSESHVTVIAPSTQVDALQGTTPALLALGPHEENIGKSGVVSSSYSGYQLSPNWYLGLSTATPFGLGTKNQAAWAGQQLAVNADVRSIDVNAIVGWKVNDLLSLAAGPRVVWLKGKFSRSIFATGTQFSEVGLDVDDIGFGFSAGITLTPNANWEIALGYRSQVKFNLEGDIQFPTMSGGFGALLGVRNGLGATLSGNVTSPDQATLGMRYRVSPAVTLLGTVEWTNWSTVQTIPFTYTNGPLTGGLATTLTFNYRDGWFFALGGEYDWDARTKLRAGIGYEISPVTTPVRDTSLPDANRWWFSTGLTQKVTDKLTLDVGYSFVWVPTADINVGAAHPDILNLIGVGAAPAVLAEAKTHLHIVSLAARYRFFDPPAPVIAKN